MRINIFFYRFIFFVFSILFCTNIIAQSSKKIKRPSLDKKNVHSIKLKKDRSVSNIRSAYIKGELENGSIKLLIQDLDILEPVILNIVAANPNEPLDIQLLKDNWDNVVQEKKNVDKIFETNFRTHKKFGIRISSSAPDAKFHLALFVGEKHKNSKKGFFYPVANFLDNEGATPKKNIKIENMETEDQPEGTSMITYLIAFLLFAILAILILMFFKKNKNTTNFFLILIMISSSQVCLAGIRPISPSNWGSLGDAIGRSVTNPAAAMNTFLNEANRVISGGNRFQPLSESDRDQVPRIDPREMPSLPSSCYESTQDGNSSSSGNQSNSSPSRNDNSQNNSGRNNNDPERDNYEPEKDNDESGANKDDDIEKDNDEYDPTKDDDDIEKDNDEPEKDKNEYDPTKDDEPEKDNDEYDPDKDRRGNSPASSGQNSRNQSRSSTFNSSNGSGSGVRGMSSGSTRRSSSECRCLEDAYEQFFENYYRLERLRIFYNVSQKQTKADIAFGDNFSGVHALSGLAWQKQRKKIMKSVATFQRAYDDKYDEIIDETFDILKTIDHCEAQLGFEGWYRRSGFMYFQFVKLRYQRND